MDIDLEDLKEKSTDNKEFALGIIFLLSHLVISSQSDNNQKELLIKVENLEKETAFLKGQLSVILKGD